MNRNLVVGIGGGCALVAMWAFSFVVMAALIVLGPGLLLGFMLAAGCEDQLGPLVTSPDPDGGFVAQVRSSDCGAVGWNTRVVVKKQYTFAFDESPQQIEFALGGVRPESVELEWTSETSLFITHQWSPLKASEADLVEWQGAEIRIGFSSYQD